MKTGRSGRIIAKIAAFGVVAAGLAGCAAPPPTAQPWDPLEPANRGVHAFNTGLDRFLVRPASQGYGTIVPAPVRQGVSNFASNLDLPGDVVNGMLQGNTEGAIQNTFRFVINTIIGIGGVFDPASKIGLVHDQTDFGQTLHVWGVGEGPYLELPAFGPSNLRDGVGTVADIMFNPMGYVLEFPEKDYATGAKLMSKVGDRYRFGSTIDSILYESADSYAQARLLYLQNRRFELGQTVDPAEGGDSFIDPYEE